MNISADAWKRRQDTLEALTETEQFAYLCGVSQAFSTVFQMIGHTFSQGGDLSNLNADVAAEWNRIEAEMKVKGLL